MTPPPLHTPQRCFTGWTRAGRRHNLVTGGSPSPIPLWDVPTSLSPVLPLSLSWGQGQGPEFLPSHCTLLSIWSPSAPPLAPKLPKHPKTLMSPAQAQEVLQPFAYPVGPSRPVGQIEHLTRLLPQASPPFQPVTYTPSVLVSCLSYFLKILDPFSSRILSSGPLPFLPGGRLRPTLQPPQPLTRLKPSLLGAAARAFLNCTTYAASPVLNTSPANSASSLPTLSRTSAEFVMSSAPGEPPDAHSPRC